jgi:hypothetical protein
MRFRAIRRRAWQRASAHRRWSVPGQKQSVAGHVYVIEGHRGALKIGSSIDPERRRRELQTGTPVDLIIRHTVAVFRDPVMVERAAQDLLSNHRINREWFDVPEDIAVGAIYAAAYRLGALSGTLEAAPAHKSLSFGAAGLAASMPFWVLAAAGRPLGAIAYMSLILAVVLSAFMLRGIKSRSLGWLGAGAAVAGFAFLILPAHADEVPPAIDGSKYCASVSGFVNDNAVIKAGCLENEKKAERHIRALWAETPAAVRSQCQKTMALVAPSYQGLSGCLSLTVGTMWMNGELRLVPR